MGTNYPLSTISIHAPREGSDCADTGVKKMTLISIHAPREGSDHGRKSGILSDIRFQSTLPVRGATIGLEGKWSVAWNFNPRSP